MIHWSVHLIQVSDVYIILSMNRTCFFLLTYQVKSKFGPESPRNMGSGTFTVLNYLKRLDWICHMWSQICCRFFLGGAIFRCQNRTAWNVQMTIKCWGTDYRHHRWGHWGLTMFIQYVHISKRLINGQNRSGWFKVTFSSSSWRSLNHLKGALCHPKKVTKKIARFEAFPIVFFWGGLTKQHFFAQFGSVIWKKGRALEVFLGNILKVSANMLCHLLRGGKKENDMWDLTTIALHHSDCFHVQLINWYNMVDICCRQSISNHPHCLPKLSRQISSNIYNVPYNFTIFFVFSQIQTA